MGWPPAVRLFFFLLSELGCLLLLNDQFSLSVLFLYLHPLLEGSWNIIFRYFDIKDRQLLAGGIQLYESLLVVKILD
jgi:hypothetical protein